MDAVQTGGFLTVGQLKELIANLPDDTQVIIGIESADEWLNVEAVEIPDFQEDFFFNLMTANTFDARQL
jgi:hypothetical protein